MLHKMGHITQNTLKVTEAYKTLLVLQKTSPESENSVVYFVT